MTYQNASDLPANVRNVLPDHAQHIYLEAFNSAYQQYDQPEERRGYDSREVVARKVAWNAVKQKYEKGGDGNWQAKA